MSGQGATTAYGCLPDHRGPDGPRPSPIPVGQEGLVVYAEDPTQRLDPTIGHDRPPCMAPLG